MTGQILKIDGARSLTSSGWVQWQGVNYTNEAMEHSRPTVFKKVKNFFKEQKRNFSVPTDLSMNSFMC